MARTRIPARGTSCDVDTASLRATGGSLTGVTVTVTVAEEVRLDVSTIVYEN